MVHGSKQSHTETAQFLFNQNRYLQAHRLTGLTFSDDALKPTCSITCVEAATGAYVSGLHAPFGGIECSDITRLDGMLKELVHVYKVQGAASVTVKQAPAFYQTTSASIHAALLTNGFQLLHADTNQHVPVNRTKTFAAQIDYQKRRSLRILKEKGAHAAVITSVEPDEWYELLLKSRRHKNFPVTVSKEAYEQLGRQLPDLYQYIGVFLDGVLIANAVCVQVTNDVIYYFLAASDPDFDVLSPSLMLIETLYDHACTKNIKVIDLGISSVAGVLNTGLHFFKRQVGALDSEKSTYVYYF